MNVDIGRFWLTVDWYWQRWYVEVYRESWHLGFTLGPFGLTVGMENRRDG